MAGGGQDVIAVITAAIDMDIAPVIALVIVQVSVKLHRIMSIVAKTIRDVCRNRQTVPAVGRKAVLPVNGLTMYLPIKMGIFIVRVIKVGGNVPRVAGNLSQAILNRKRQGLKMQVLNRKPHTQVLARNHHKPANRNLRGIALTNHLANHWKRVLRRDSEVHNEAVVPCHQEAAVLVVAGCEAVVVAVYT